MTTIPKLSVPLRLVPNGAPTPNLFLPEAWSGAIDTYRTASGATLTSDPAVFHGFSPGTKVVTPGSKALEGADSGAVIAVKAGVTYPIRGWIRGNAGGEALTLFAGDGTIGNVVKGFIATKEEWQLVEVDYTPTVSGITGVAVVTQGKHAVTYWVDDLKVLGATPVSLATVEQGSVDEIAGCVYAQIATPRGSRMEEQDFGVEEPTFRPLPLDVSEWLEQIKTWEPRASIETAQQIEDTIDLIEAAVGSS